MKNSGDVGDNVPKIYILSCIARLPKTRRGQDRDVAEQYN